MYGLVGLSIIRKNCHLSSSADFTPPTAHWVQDTRLNCWQSQEHWRSYRSLWSLWRWKWWGERWLCRHLCPALNYPLWGTIKHATNMFPADQIQIKKLRRDFLPGRATTWTWGGVQLQTRPRLYNIQNHHCLTNLMKLRKNHYISIAMQYWNHWCYQKIPM